MKNLSEKTVRVIKISKDALFEFIYENMIDIQCDVLELDPEEEVTNSIDMDWENGTLIFCAHKTVDGEGNLLHLPAEIDLQKVMRNIPDTTSTMYQEGRYRDYTKEELAELSK